MPFTSYALVFASAAVAGAINSVAGGGTLLTYPILVSIIGLNPIVANATSTMALWPGSMAGAWSFRSSLKDIGRWALPFSIVSALGGATGAILLWATPTKAFEAIIPWLIVLAATLFVTHEPVMKRLGIARVTDDRMPEYTPLQWRGLLGVQFLVSVYGGYFGAGIGIMMLASLSVMRFGGLFRINALKNVAAFLINIVAAGVFGYLGLVDWRISPVMAGGAIAGALLGSGVAKKIGPHALRIVISVLGFVIATYYVLQNFGVIRK